MGQYFFQSVPAIGFVNIGEATYSSMSFLPHNCRNQALAQACAVCSPSAILKGGF